MKIAIIGPGALGCLFAARMADAGIDVTLVDHRSDRAARLKDSGIRVETSEGEDLLARPNVATSVPSKQDLIMVLVKAHATAYLKLSPKSPVLTVQNGLGNVETLCESVGSTWVLGGATSEASTLVGEGHARQAAKGVTQFGAWTSCSTEAAEAAFVKAGFAYEVTDSPGQAIWRKVAVSAGINPLTALLDVPNGRLVELPQARQLMRDLVVEATKVASTEGYRFEYSLVEYAEQVCRDTADNISSMLQDVRAGRKTEVDAITYQILSRAEAASLPTPRTRMMWQLLSSLEQR